MEIAERALGGMMDKNLASILVVCGIVTSLIGLSINSDVLFVTGQIWLVGGLVKS